MAGAGWRDFTVGELVTEPLFQTYIMDQAVMVFASASARTTALAAPSEGMVSYLTDTNLVYFYDGSAWTQIPATVNVRKNSTGSVFTRPRLNLIEGTNITLTVADDSTDGEVDVTITSATQSGYITSAMKTADESVVASSTLQDDDHLTLAVTTNTNYSFEAWLHLTQSANPDFRCAFTVPASSSLAWVAVAPSTSWVMTSLAPVTTSGTALIPELRQNPGWVHITGTLRTAGTAGNLTLQWAQSNPSGTTTLYAGSWLRLVKVGL